MVSYDQRGKEVHTFDFFPISLSRLCSDLNQLLQTLHISKCHPIGHSMGGTVASIFGVEPSRKSCPIILIEDWVPYMKMKISLFSESKTFASKRGRFNTPSMKIFMICVFEFKSVSLTLESFNLQTSEFGGRSGSEKGWTWRYDARHKDANAISS